MSKPVEYKGEPAGVPVAAPEGLTPEDMARRERTFRNALAGLINVHSRENGSGTPDFILAEYLADCLAAWDKNVRRREEWYGRKANAVFNAD